MTVIAGIVDRGGVWLGSDSASSTDWTSELTRDAKIFGLRAGDEDLGVAIAGSWMFGHRLRYQMSVPTIPRGVDVAEWMNTVFSDALTTLIDESLGDQVQDERWKDMKQGCALVAIRGRLFQVDASDSTALEFAKGYTANGSAAYFALGAFAATADRQPYERIRLALKAAIAHGRGVRPPIHIRFFGKPRGPR